VTKPAARSVQFVVVDAGAPGRAEQPVAVGYPASPSWSGLMKSAMFRAEMWVVPGALVLQKRMRVTGGAEVQSVLR